MPFFKFRFPGSNWPKVANSLVGSAVVYPGKQHSIKHGDTMRPVKNGSDRRVVESATPVVDSIVCPGIDADKFLSYVRSLAYDMPRRFLFPSVLDVGSKAMRAANTAIRKRGTRDISTPHMLPRGGATAK